MLNLLADYHEKVVYPATETLVKNVVRESEKRIMDNLGGKLDKVEEGLDSVEEKVDNLGKKFDVMREEINSTQDRQDKRLEQLEVAVA